MGGNGIPLPAKGDAVLKHQPLEKRLMQALVGPVMFT